MNKYLNKIMNLLYTCIIIRLLIEIIKFFSIHITGILYYIIALCPLIIIFILDKKIDIIKEESDIKLACENLNILLWTNFIFSLLSFNEFYILINLLELCLIISMKNDNFRKNSISNFIPILITLIIYLPIYFGKEIINEVENIDNIVVWQDKSVIKTVSGINRDYHEYIIETTYNFYILKIHYKSKLKTCDELNERINNYQNAEWIKDNACV